MKNRNIPHKDDWKTPIDLYNKLDKEFSFDFDPCPYQHDISKWNGLQIEWGNVNFCNPPYSSKLKQLFVRKAVEESIKGKICVLLIPVSTSTALFHDYILPNAKEIRFIKGRVKFAGVNTKGKFVTNETGMHDSMIVVFDNCKEKINNQLRLF